MEMRHLLVNPKNKELCGKSYTIELGRLAQGIPKGTRRCPQLPTKGHYLWPCMRQLLTQKDVPNRTRLTMGRNRITYPGNCGTPTVDMVMVKIHLNRVISTKGAQYCTIDLHRLGLLQHECSRIHAALCA